ncbi:MAG: TatD family hydrolase [Solobacterium sp.]|nr:TatD family hydrolase [Solobacterium sp.]
MKYIDSHVHLFVRAFREDFRDVLQRAQDAGVERMMIITTDAEEARRAMPFVEKDPYRFQLAYGIHPQRIDEVDDAMVREFDEIAEDPRITAIGEIGLDYITDRDHKELQKEVFIHSIKKAVSLNKPILVHSRKAIQDTYNIMKAHPARALMHSFPGSLEMSREFIKLGYYISYGGPATWLNVRHAREVVADMDLNYLLTETDAPYVTPEPFRGQRNEPCNLPYILRALASYRGMTEEALAEIVLQNYRRFLGEE